MPASVASAYYNGLVLATVLLASAILLLSIDDLFVDAWFWCRELYRRLTVWRVHRPLTANQLYERDEQPLAIMIPAWLEQAVIAPMIENMVTTLDYRNYLIFVGTYVNDPATIAEVERMRRRFRQLIRVEVPHAGPTCKADCLNWIVQAIFLHEQTSDIEFAGMVLHDGEDVLHPLELKLFNYILPRKDFIQIPVTSLERRWDELVAGTYMDEFAEWHARDLVVRESLSRMVPSAGVGTCFSRRALITLVRETNNQPFNTDSLTEDYDVGARLAQRGMQSIFCRFPVIFRVQRQKSFGFSPKKEVRLRMALCVREYFPDTFRAAYRQKARWILGICFQGWQQVGWSGSLAVKYLLFRDRKGIVTPFINIAAYILTAQLLAFYIAAYCGWWPSPLPDRLLDWRIVLLFYANGAVFLWRISQRCYFVSRLYGWEHGLLSIPRIVIGNLVNFMAASRAWKIFLSHVLFGSRIVWDKTDHDFPSADILVQRRRRLGELLVAWRAVDEDSLAMALHRQQSNGLPLGRMLIADGLLDEETVAEAIAYQSNLPRAHPTTEQIREAMGTLSIDTCVRWRIAPIGIDPAGRVMLATAGPPTTAIRQDVAKSLSQEPSWHVVRESEIAGALRVMRPNETVTGTDAVPLLGDAERRNVALALADAALSAKQPQRAVDALQPYANDKTYAVASRRAFALLALGEKEEALSAFSSAAELAKTAQERATMLKAQINLLADLGRRADAKALFQEAKTTGALDGASDLDIAYLAVRLGDDTTATALFGQAKASGNLTGAAMLDAGYAAKRSVDNAEAIADFKAAIDANAEGKLPLSPQSLFETRREVAELERTWGAFASLTYGAVGVMPSSSLTPPPVGRILQAGTEVYWRPPVIGYRDGRIFEVFVRSFETLSDATGAPTGAPTWQGAAGMRVKPFSDFNLVLEGARVFPIGTNARQDWLARVAFSHGDGTDLRYDATNWTMWQIYAEYDRYFQTVENVVAYEARLGRSFRLDAISDRLVATPFLALGGSYDSLFATPSALGAGPGVSIRWWFREDKYTAPMSFIDLNVQYRFKLAGDDRARGVFVGLTLAF